MRRTRRSPVAIVLLLVALGAAACGSGGDEEATGGSAATSPASAAASAAVPDEITGTAATTSSSAPTGPTATAGASGPTDHPTPVEPDPGNVACQLLTEEIAEPMIGVDLSVAGDVATGNHSTCVLRDTAGTVSVELRITLGSDAKREYDELYASVEGAHGVRLLDGLGDEAFQAVATNDAPSW